MRQKFEWMFSVLNRALSWAITSLGNKFCLKKRSRLMKAFDNKFYVRSMPVEIGLLFPQLFNIQDNANVHIVNVSFVSFILELGIRH